MAARDLKDEVCVITGASSGFGEALAEKLVAQGAYVVLAARSADKLERLAARLGEHAEAVPTDVSQADQVARLFAHVQARHGGLDLLFNNAGVGYYERLEDSDPAHWREQIDANIYGVLHCAQAAIPLMQGRRAPLIMNVASVAGRRGFPGWSVYCATKFAVVGFSQALRRELSGRGIRVAVIEPGMAYTRWGYGVPAADMQATRDAVHALQAEDIADAVLYAFAQPAHVNPQEILLIPTEQEQP